MSVPPISLPPSTLDPRPSTPQPHPSHLRHIHHHPQRHPHLPSCRRHPHPTLHQPTEIRILSRPRLPQFQRLRRPTHLPLAFIRHLQSKPLRHPLQHGHPMPQLRRRLHRPHPTSRAHLEPLLQHPTPIRIRQHRSLRRSHRDHHQAIRLPSPTTLFYRYS